eukprot:3869234-Rhodomonas_salina.3
MAELEPDMEHDPTLASCCQREFRDRRIKQEMMDNVRSGMPSTLVDKGLIKNCCSQPNCSCDADKEYPGRLRCLVARAARSPVLTWHTGRPGAVDIPNWEGPTEEEIDS